MLKIFTLWSYFIRCLYISSDSVRDSAGLQFFFNPTCFASWIAKQSVPHIPAPSALPHPPPTPLRTGSCSQSALVKVLRGNSTWRGAGSHVYSKELPYVIVRASKAGWKWQQESVPILEAKNIPSSGKSLWTKACNWLNDTILVQWWLSTWVD